MIKENKGKNMPIYKYKMGNLFHFVDDYKAIVHGCNCFHTMGGGFAKQVKGIYPEAYQTDKFTEYGSICKMGTISHTQEQRDPMIINAYTQYGMGRDSRKVEYTAIRTCMEEVDNLLEFTFEGSGLVSVAMPKIGSGLGGGDWKIISRIINTTTPNLNITVFER